MATKKMSLHGSKKRSNSSPELQLQVTDIDTFLAASASVVVNTNGIMSGKASTRANLQQAMEKNHGDDVKSSNTHSTDEDRIVKTRACSARESTCKAMKEIQEPSVRPKVTNGWFKTKNKQTNNLARCKQQDQVGADSIVMTVDESNSETSTLSSSDTEEVCLPSKGQVFGRVASLLVAHFRNKTRKRQRRGSNSESDSSTASAKDVETSLPRPRSKSFSGRIMRKLGTKEKGSTDSPQHELPKRKAQSHVSRIQSCIGVVFTSKQKNRSPKCEAETQQHRRFTPVINLEDFNPDDYPVECEDEIQRVLREQEIRDGVDPPPGYQPQFLAEVETHSKAGVKNAEKSYHNSGRDGKIRDTSSEVSTSNVAATTYPVVQGSNHTTANIYDQYGSLTPEGFYIPRTVHTQIDYMHCLVPDQQSIIGSSFYWGKIDRFEADLLLENKPEGTFLLRDSAHDEFVFSVSFRRYGRTLHARIEQWKHKFSFDAHDPGVYSSDTICGLLKHYKDPNFCMFFEPMLTIPLPRPNPPSLQELARATVCSHTTYDGITHLALPRTLKEYSREYHYKQRVRMRRFEVPEIPVAVEPQIGTIITKTCISR